MTKTAISNDLYEADFYEWTRQQAKLLRERRWDDLDLENLVEEVQSVGISDKREIASLGFWVLLAHLLKWMFQPGIRNNSWSGTIDEQRSRIGRVLADSPSLKNYPESVLVGEYDSARDFWRPRKPVLRSTFFLSPVRSRSSRHST